jgi:serine/threonine protein kinase
MPAPTNATELLELVRKSGVVDIKRLDAYLAQLTAAGPLPTEPAVLATQMVHDGVLTHFQAEQFMMGKWRRFTIGKYKVLERLGSGGMGSVYLCEHKLMRRRVAVKVLPTAKAEDPAALERFYREARAVAALDHPNIVRAYDIDQDDRLHFLVMEHVDGSNLQEIIKKTGPLDPIRAAHYMRQAALGLQHAHEAAGLVHRDIKPGNILVDRNGIVKVLDMGLARFFHEEEDSITRKYDESVLGTADYLAPEQAINSHEVDIRADIYSLGATMYYCLTGKTPFNEGSIAQKLIWHQTRQPKSIKLLRPEVPEGIVAVVERSMAKDPNQRFADPQAMAEALATWTQTPIPPPSPIEMPQLSRAAMAGPGDYGGPPSGPISSGGGATSATRKTWLVAGGGPPSQTTPPSGLPAPPPATPAPAPPVVTPVVDSPPSPPPTRDTRTDTSALSEPSAGTAPSPALPATPAKAGSRRVSKSQRPTPGPEVRRVKVARAVVQAPAVEEEDDDSPAWGNISGDTEEIAARADTYSGRRKSGTYPRVVPSTGPLPLTERRWFWWAIGGAAGGAVLLFLLVLWALKSSAPKPSSAAPTTREPLAVFSTDRGGAAESLRARLRSATNGDVIEINDDIAASDVVNTAVLRARTLTIEGRAGKTVVWRAPPGGAATLLKLGNAAGLTLRNLTFDGEGQVDALVSVFGESTGLTLEKVRFRGFRRCGVCVTNCAGSPDRPVALSSLHFTTTEPGQSGIYFDINPSVQGITKDQYITVRDCSFDGPGAKVKARDPSLLDHVELPDGLAVSGE